MNKKKVLLIILAIVILIGVLEYMSRSSHDINGRAYWIITGAFDFDEREYSGWINLYPDGHSVGEITDAKDAVNKAITLWNEEFGGFSSMNSQPYYADYDENFGCWRILASLPENTFGAPPVALLLDDGTVLAVWLAYSGVF